MDQQIGTLKRNESWTKKFQKGILIKASSTGVGFRERNIISFGSEIDHRADRLGILIFVKRYLGLSLVWRTHMGCILIYIF